MEFESAHSNTTAKLPILKLGEYEMWVIRIKQYFQVQDYALWEVIKNGNSWVSVPQTAQENGTSVTKISVHVTAEEKTKKKNDVKARILLLMALPNEHQLNFSQYTDSKIMFATIETRFGESLDSIFNRLQKIVSRLAILGVVIAKEDLNSKFLSNLPPEWNTHVKSVGASSGAQNLAFMTAPSTSSTNDVNTAIPAYEVSTASFSDNVVYDFMIENPNGSNLSLVPSCFVIFDLEPLSLSFDFVFSSEIFKSLSFRLDRLCHLAILCLDQHAHTLHHLESLLTISLDRLDIFEGRSCISEFVRKSLSLILELS
ncbi:hypothetical protein Tco_0897085 [Tanacetum coccineum]